MIKNATTVGELIEVLKTYPQDMRLFGYNADDSMWYQGISTRETKEIGGGVCVFEDQHQPGYWWSESKQEWVEIK